MADQFFGATDPGKQRANNEDTFISQKSANGKFIIACVIDGVGGYSGGEVAAAIAREAIIQRLNKSAGEIVPTIIDCFNLANERIHREKQKVKENANMACVATLAIVDIAHNLFYYAHVGDTRLYLLRDKSLIKISHDQSFVGFLEDSGRLTEEEAMDHPKRNEINKALGFENQLMKDADYIETGQSPFLPGDMLLLCSDGLTDMVGSEKITSIISKGNSLKEKCRKLVDAANQQGGRDNITVVLVQNTKVPVQHNATMPVATPQKNEEIVSEQKAEVEEEPVVVDEETPVTEKKGNKGIIILLTLLVCLFLGSSIWLFLLSPYVIKSQPKQITVVVKKPLNAQQQKLQKAIDQLKGHVLILSDTSYKSPVLINDAINIDKDTLFIRAKGKIELQCDSGYKGPALSLSEKCKYIVLDSVSFINFKIGVTSFENAVKLKNTRFVNCLIPMQSLFSFKDKKYISGQLPSAAFKADSLPVKNR